MTARSPPAPLGAYRVASVRIKRRRGRQPVVVTELAPTTPGDPPMTYHMPVTKPARAAKPATKPLNLYLLTQTTSTGHDTFDACIVAAPDARAAKRIHPYESRDLEKSATYDPWDSLTWANNPQQVTACLVGTAEPGTKPGVILASFNAG